MSKIFLLISCVVIIACSNAEETYVKPIDKGADTTENITIVYNERAKEIFDKIEQFYKLTSGTYANLYKENYPALSGDPAASYLWPFVGFNSGAATLKKLGYSIDYEGIVDRFELYFDNSRSPSGYASAAFDINGSARFYDDNSIVGIELVEAYNITKDQRFLDRAAVIVSFLKSGEDDLLGGALWWVENQKNIPGAGDSNKPACANGYATNFLLSYYQVCPQSEKPEVLAFAKRLYMWLKANLQDPSDKCYWNDKNANGNINTTKWTYNSGVMIQNGVRLYQISGEQKYLDDAIETANGAYNYFVKIRNDVLSYPDHDPWFNTKLLAAYIEITPYSANAKNYVKTYIDFMNNGWQKARTDDGFFYEDWTGASPKRYQSFLMQAAVLESYGLAALYLGEKVE